jgi:DNA invertase Pin-like site-specific DNA recombinase
VSRNALINAISVAQSDDPIERIEQLVAARSFIDLKIEEAVREARTTDRWKGTHIDHVPGRTVEQREENEFGIASWQQIADALGVSRQSAHRKFVHLVEE